MADALVKLLNKAGYLPVFLPRTGMDPPEMYTMTEDHRLVRRGALEPFLPAVKDLVRKSGAVAQLEYEQTSSKEQKAALSFLQNALKCIGITGAPKLDVSFAGKTSLSFSFTGVTFRAVDPSQLDGLIKDLKTDGLPPEYVDDGHLHIAYEYLYAKKLMMSRTDQKEFEHDIGASIGSYVDVGVKGKVAVESKTTISFEATDGDPAAFGYKAGGLRRSNGRWSFYPEEITAGLESTGGGDISRPYLPARGVVLELRSDTSGASS